MSIQYDDSEFRKMLNELSGAKKEVAEKAYKYFLRKTPIKSGYARRHTNLTVNNSGATISADYNYASSLDEGKSKQSPEGMTGPTEKEVKRLMEQYIKKVGK